MKPKEISASDLHSNQSDSLSRWCTGSPKKKTRLYPDEHDNLSQTVFADRCVQFRVFPEISSSQNMRISSETDDNTMPTSVRKVELLAEEESTKE